ncbi:hypothetical protein ACQCP0_22365 [Ralstonia pseudosolanacearum]|uniref:Uncharacterized protein n=3 Tax=Ralstonia solanacearum species complex TaxID=3116862 RepID=A0A454TJ86_9RALS|nr:hypothetical protein [Ralstonia pseudosolanacearum]APC65911.1 hypothetical protein RSOE_00485 [Ralstonia solanacearum OE1-1]KAF3458845.1 hypothetical protein GO278_004933 [Ralstonia solanacearum]API76757.1 hypothetical protein AC251_19225 [Ralstonia pseudosolanacearum]ASL75979.1 hypothetical protein BC350_20440 [Ralstonia pseudosolanacearum]AST88841.1 hypothetical protein CIG66_20770 [Ralstonia pseudosolanacearum]
MKPVNRRLAFLLLALAGSAGLVLFGSPATQTEVVQPSRSAAPSQLPAISIGPASASAGNTTVLALRPREASPDIAQAFPSRDWAPPPPPPPPPAPPPKPMAPPLPFVVIGKKWEDGQWQVFLGRNEETFVVKAGDTFDGRYRVDSIVPPSMTLIYLPLKARQTLTIGNME